MGQVHQTPSSSFSIEVGEATAEQVSITDRPASNQNEHAGKADKCSWNGVRMF